MFCGWFKGKCATIDAHKNIMVKEKLKSRYAQAITSSHLYNFTASSDFKFFRLKRINKNYFLG